jgi:hypothetical protein
LEESSHFFVRIIGVVFLTSLERNFAEEKDVQGGLRVVFWSRDKWKKDKYLGETSIELARLVTAPHTMLLEESTKLMPNSILFFPFTPTEMDPTTFPSMQQLIQQQQKQFAVQHFFELELQNEKKKKGDEDVATTDSPVLPTSPSASATREKDDKPQEPARFVVKIYCQANGWQVLFNLLNQPTDITLASKALSNLIALADSPKGNKTPYRC